MFTIKLEFWWTWCYHIIRTNLFSSSEATIRFLYVFFCGFHRQQAADLLKTLQILGFVRFQNWNLCRKTPFMDMILISSFPQFPCTLCAWHALFFLPVSKRPKATMCQLCPPVTDPGKETWQSRHVGGILIPTANSVGSPLRPRNWRCPEGHCGDSNFRYRK